MAVTKAKASRVPVTGEESTRQEAESRKEFNAETAETQRGLYG